MKRAVVMAVVVVALGACWWWWSTATPSTPVDAARAEPLGRPTDGEQPPRVTANPTLRPFARERPTPPLDPGSPSDGGPSAEAVRAYLTRNAADAVKYVDRFCEENRTAGEGPQRTSQYVERDPPRRHDAAIYLDVRVGWLDRHRASTGLLQLPTSLRERLENPPGNWLTFTDADYAGLDFSWMTQLLDFDHWSLAGDGLLKNEDGVGFWDSPLPNYLILRDWAKLRLVKGKNEHDLAQASLEVRHVGDLIASNGAWVSELMRSKFYGLERSAWDAAGQQPAEPLPSADDLERLRQSTFASHFFLFPGVPKEVREKALACARVRCVAVTEALGMAAGTRDLEPDAADDLEWLSAQPGCDRALAQQYARKTTSLPQDLQLPTSTSDLSHWMKLLTDGGVD